MTASDKCTNQIKKDLLCRSHPHRSFDEWTETFGTERLTGAILDMLTHHVHILEMNGESFRLRESRKSKTKS